VLRGNVNFADSWNDVALAMFGLSTDESILDRFAIRELNLTV
jgi:hypothetical protein